MKPQISVIIATYNRAAMFRQTLEAMRALDLTKVSAEFVVADNGSSDATSEVVGSFRNCLAIKYCFEPRRGQNAARNRALELAEGDLLVFTDDDILTDAQWLRQWTQGVDRWPHHDVFGGPIFPEWPCEVPEYIRALPFFENAYSILDPQQGEGPFVQGRPWSGNFGIRRHLFEQGLRFNEQVGPAEGNYIMGSESELLARVAAAGQTPIFLPHTGVRHVITAAQLTPKWLYGRAYRYGRSLRYFADPEKTPAVFGIPRYLVKFLAEVVLSRAKCWMLRDQVGFVRDGMRYWMIRGQMRQSRCSPKGGGVIGKLDRERHDAQTTTTDNPCGQAGSVVEPGPLGNPGQQEDRSG